MCFRRTFFRKLKYLFIEQVVALKSTYWGVTKTLWLILGGVAIANPILRGVANPILDMLQLPGHGVDHYLQTFDSLQGKKGFLGKGQLS